LLVPATWAGGMPIFGGTVTAPSSAASVRSTSSCHGLEKRRRVP
jgi:hypothetical protein